VTNARNLLEVFVAQFDLLEVLDDPGLLNTLGNDGVSTLCAPCDQNLGRGSAELLSHGFDSVVVDEKRITNGCENREKW
jgi:hypothetical protein